LKQKKILAVNQYFYCLLVATKLLTAKLHSRLGVGLSPRLRNPACNTQFHSLDSLIVM